MYGINGLDFQIPSLLLLASFSQLANTCNLTIGCAKHYCVHKFQQCSLMKEDKYVCPDCGSNNICKLSIIHRNGISSSEGNASQHGDWLGINDVKVNTKSQNRASERAAPPANPFQMLFGWIVVEIMVFIGFTITMNILQYYFKQPVSPPSIFQLISFVIFMLGALFATFICFAAIVTYPSDKAKWNNSYHCQRCDSNFLLRL
jgi:hypothetical protein